MPDAKTERNCQRTDVQAVPEPVVTFLIHARDLGFAHPFWFRCLRGKCVFSFGNCSFLNGSPGWLVFSLYFWGSEEHFSGTQKVWTFSGQSTQEVSFKGKPKGNQAFVGLPYCETNPHQPLADASILSRLVQDCLVHRSSVWELRKVSQPPVVLGFGRAGHEPITSVLDSSFQCVD